MLSLLITGFTGNFINLNGGNFDSFPQVGDLSGQLRIESQGSVAVRAQVRNVSTEFYRVFFL